MLLGPGFGLALVIEVKQIPKLGIESRPPGDRPGAESMHGGFAALTTFRCCAEWTCRELPCGLLWDSR